MEFQNKDIDKIESYIRGELSVAEAQEFEDLILHDQAWKKAYEVLAILNDAPRMEQQLRDRQALKAIAQKQDRRSARRKQFLLTFVPVAIVAGGFIAYLMSAPPGSKGVTTPNSKDSTSMYKDGGPKKSDTFPSPAETPSIPIAMPPTKSEDNAIATGPEPKTPEKGIYEMSGSTNSRQITIESLTGLWNPDFAKLKDEKPIIEAYISKGKYKEAARVLIAQHNETIKSSEALSCDYLIKAVDCYLKAGQGKQVNDLLKSITNGHPCFTSATLRRRYINNLILQQNPALSKDADALKSLGKADADWLKEIELLKFNDK
jgi:hypothetical protein